MARTNWHINPRALQRVCRELGVKGKLRIEWRDCIDGDPDIAGQNIINEDGTEHGVLLRRGHTRLKTLDSLLHELRHAAQRQDDPHVHGVMYLLADQMAGYRDNPFERDARDFAAKAAGRYDDLLQEPRN